MSAPKVEIVMDAMAPQAAAMRICAIVQRMLVKRAISKTVGTTDNLREAGLSSLDMVNLMLAIEGEFDIFIPQAEMTPENFVCIDAIEAMMARLTAA